MASGGLLPQSDVVPEPTAFNCTRTPWTDDADVGRGYHPERDRFYPSALDLSDGHAPSHFTPEAAQRGVVAQAQLFKVLDGARDFASSFLQSSPAGLKAWSVSSSTAFDAPVSARSITVTLRRCYSSDPLMAIKAGLGGYRLSEAGYAAITGRYRGGEALANPLDSGHEEFVKRHGTHFVAGYTLGGIFSGFLNVNFWTAEAATAAHSAVESILSTFTARGNTADVENEFAKIPGFRSISSGYQALGWRGQPSTTPCSAGGLGGLVAAADSVEFSGGQRLEAMLVPYSELEDFRAAVALRSTTQAPRLLLVARYGTIAQLLNHECLRLEFHSRLLEDLSELPPGEDVHARVAALTHKVLAAQKALHMRFSQDSGAAANWLALSDYVMWVRSRAEYPDGSTVPEDADARLGFTLAKAVFRANAVQEEYEKLMKAIIVSWTLHANVRVLSTGASEDKTMTLRADVVFEYDDCSRHRFYALKPGVRRNKADVNGIIFPGPTISDLMPHAPDIGIAGLPKDGAVADRRPVRVTLWRLQALDDTGRGEPQHKFLANVWNDGTNVLSRFEVPRENEWQAVGGFKKWDSGVDNFRFSFEYSSKPSCRLLTGWEKRLG